MRARLSIKPTVPCIILTLPVALVPVFCRQDYELLDGSRAMNEVAMCGQLQNSVTACVYFLPPHRVKKVDLILISAISQLVSLIVLLKTCADCYRQLQ